MSKANLLTLPYLDLGKLEGQALAEARACGIAQATLTLEHWDAECRASRRLTEPKRPHWVRMLPVDDPRRLAFESAHYGELLALTVGTVGLEALSEAERSALCQDVFGPFRPDRALEA